MRALALVAACACACGKTRVPECDALLGTIEKISRCEKIPKQTRESVGRGANDIRNALKMLEEVGGRASESQRDEVATNCKSQDAKIRGLYEKSAPECLE